MTTAEVQAVRVHIDNADEIGERVKVARTQEMEPEHFTTSTFILPGLGLLPSPGGQVVLPTQVLQLDPLRKTAVLSFNGNGQVILAHSQQQVQSLQANVQTAADEGALITCPTTIRVTGTAPLWAVGIPSSTSPVSGVTSGGNKGAVTDPGAFATIVSTTALTGTYQVTVTVYVDGTTTAADGDNMEFNANGTVTLAYPGTVVFPVTYTFTETLTATSMNVKSVAAASGAAAVYHAQITYTQIAGPGSANVLSVGVVQERRNR